MTPKDALSNPQLVTNLLKRLDKVARAEDAFEYGLPLFNESASAALREQVYLWLADPASKI